MEELKKGLILIGPPQSGKSIIANVIGNLDQKLKFHLDGTQKKLFDNPYVFAGITPSHQVIIIDDLLHIENLRRLIPLVGGTITVNTRGQEPFTMPCPQIVVTSDSFTMEDLLKQGQSFTRRFHIIELSRTGYPASGPTGLMVDRHFTEFCDENLSEGGLYHFRNLQDKLKKHTGWNAGFSPVEAKSRLKEWAESKGMVLNPPEMSDHFGRIICVVDGYVNEFIFLKKEPAHENH